MLPASSPLIYIPNPKDTIEAPLGFGAGGGTLRSNRRLLALRAAQFGSIRSPAGQNAPPERFVLPASSPLIYIPNPKSTIKAPLGFGAGGGTRTHTMSPSTDFESVTSANSITPAKSNFRVFYHRVRSIAMPVMKDNWIFFEVHRILQRSAMRRFLY